jgi:2-oxoglutarate ferredoxin oxidoreductase subunit delta
MTEIASRGTVVIAKDRCKGCELCIPACPPEVLQMSLEANAIGFAYPELSPGCTGCGACLLVCPDFCFEVYRYAEPVVHVVQELAPAQEAMR